MCIDTYYLRQVSFKSWFWKLHGTDHLKKILLLKENVLVYALLLLK